MADSWSEKGRTNKQQKVVTCRVLKYNFKLIWKFMILIEKKNENKQQDIWKNKDFVKKLIWSNTMEFVFYGSELEEIDTLLARFQNF